MPYEYGAEKSGECQIGKKIRGTSTFILVIGDTHSIPRTP